MNDVSGKNKSLNSKIINVVYYLFFSAVAAAAMYYCFKNIKIKDIGDQLKSADLSLIALSIIPTVTAFAVRALRWQILIEPLGRKPAFGRVYNAVMIGYLANLAIPRIGEVTRCAALNRTDKISGVALFGTVVTERVIDLLSLMLITVSVFFVKMDLFSEFFSTVSGQWSVFLVEITTFHIAAGISAIVVIILVLYALRHKISGFSKSIVGGLISVFKMKRYFIFFVYTVVIWTCFWSTSYLIALSLPSTSILTPSDGLLLMVIGSLGWVVPTPGGMGSFHWLVASALGLYGISFDPDGVIFAAIAHETQIICMLILGFISLISVMTMAKNKTSNRYSHS